MKTQTSRKGWGSRIGFILATSGAAVGLGNIQRFPYIAAESGGAVFVLLYLLCVLVLGLPLIFVEFSLGRHTHKNPVCAIEAIRPNSRWKYVGFLSIATAFFILTYYSVIAGWTIGYFVKMLRGEELDLNAFTSNAPVVLSYMAIFMLSVIYIVKKGVKKGIERYSKILMPMLLLLLIGLIIRSLTLPNSGAGMRFYLEPDFSEINGRVFINALSQAFFSLCIGEAVLITYGSYTSKEDNLISSGCYIALFDTLIAILSGLIIFPALFAFGYTPGEAGVGLSFVVLPKIFAAMPFGNIFGASFFLLLGFAALTTSIALLEMPVAYLVDSKKCSRSVAVWAVGIAAFILSIPAALSKGASPFLSTMEFLGNRGFYDIMDFVWGNMGMVFGGLLLAVFTGWVWGTKNAAKELRQGCKHFTWQSTVWGVIVRYVAPIVILAILASFFI